MTLLKKTDRSRLFAAAFFALYLVVGLALAGKYGSAIDDRGERRSSLITYRYINETVFGRLPSPKLSEYNDLPAYKDRWYGMAMQIPMAIVEDLTDFKMSDHDVFVMRHYFIFIYCFIGYLCFYFMLRRLFPANGWLPLTGTAFIMLYPRFFAQQFTDVKDQVFCALIMAVCYCMVLAAEKKRLIFNVLFGCVAALATNQRIMGVLYAAVLIGYYLLTDLVSHFSGISSPEDGGKYRLLKYPAVIIPYFAFWTIITPLAWRSPIRTFIQTFGAFSDFYGWDSTMVFMGKLITRAEMPWYYLPVWMGITIPILILLLFLAGHIFYAADIIRSNDRLAAVLGDKKWATCHLFLFWAVFFNIVLRQGPIYIGWRHVYFVFISMVVIALFSLEHLLRLINRRLVYAVVGIFFILQSAWIINRHPHQYVFFNPIGMQFGDQFDRDDMRLGILPMTRWILANEDGPVSIVRSDGREMDATLTDQELERITEEETPKYIIEDYRNIVGNDVKHEGYEEVHTVWLGKYKIASVYRLISQE